MIKKIAGTPLYVIVLVNLILKLAVFCYLSPWDKTVQDTKIVVSDSKGYEAIAENLLKYHTFGSPADTVNINHLSELQKAGFVFYYPDALRLPVYPVFMAAIYSIAGIKPFIAIFIQILLSLISVVLVYKMSMALFDNKSVAVLSSLLFSIDIQAAYLASELLTDTLFSLIFLASCYWFVKAFKNKKTKDICISAALMGLACLTRPVVLFFPVIFIFLLLFFCKQAFAVKLRSISVFVSVFLLITSVWLYRNNNKYGHWQFTTQGSNSLLMYNIAYTRMRLTHENIDTARVRLQEQADSLGYSKEKDFFKQADIYQGVAISFIKKHFAIYTLTHLEGGLNMFFSIGNKGMSKTFGWDNSESDNSFAEVNAHRAFANFNFSTKGTILGILILIVMAVQYVGCVFGMFKLFRSRNYIFISFFVLTVLYFMAVIGVVGMYRYKLPILPFICIIAGYGYFCLMQKKTNHLA